MDRLKLFQAGVDVAEGIKRFNNIKEAYERCLNKFPDDPTYPAFCAALHDKNTEEAFRTGHSLKGIAGNLSLRQLLDALVPMVEALRAGNLDEAEAMFDMVERSYDDVVNAIRSV